MIRPGPNPIRSRSRWLLALLAMGWLNLLAQPCFAGAPAAPAGMEHCDHADPLASCPAMQAAATASAHDLATDAPRDASPARLPVAILDRADAAPARHACDTPAPGARHATGPPLNIRFCNLRN